MYFFIYGPIIFQKKFLEKPIRLFYSAVFPQDKVSYNILFPKVEQSNANQ